MSYQSYRRRAIWENLKALFVYLVCIVTVLAFIVMITNVLNDSTKEDFTRDCLRDHPDAHVDVASNTGYRGWGNTYYCLGPNGELWRVG